VPYHLQFTDPAIIHDAIQNQDAAAAEKPPPKKRGRPPKNAKKDADAEGDNDDGNEAKRLKSDEGITV
jgi:hypothetical protein